MAATVEQMFPNIKEPWQMAKSVKRPFSRACCGHTIRCARCGGRMSETKTLADYVVNSRMENVAQDVRHEAKRAILNYVGCAVGGSREPAVEVALRALAPYSGKPTANVFARPERLDAMHAALINGI